MKVEPKLNNKSVKIECWLPQQRTSEAAQDVNAAGQGQAYVAPCNISPVKSSHSQDSRSACKETGGTGRNQRKAEPDKLIDNRLPFFGTGRAVSRWFAGVPAGSPKLRSLGVAAKVCGGKYLLRVGEKRIEILVRPMR